MTVYGYQRVSTKEQNLARQTEQLISSGVDASNIYTDKISGRKQHRKGLDELLGKLQQGDTLTVISLDRLARSTKQLLELSERFESQGINLVSLKENIDTTTPAGRLFFTIAAAFATFEKDMNNQRTKDGLEAARNRGVKLGRPKADPEKLAIALDMFEHSTKTVERITEITGLSRSYIYREAKKRNLVRMKR